MVDAQLLPRGRTQAGDHHLKFYETRDNLGSQPAWANAKALKSAAPASDYVNLRVYLGWRGAAAAQQAARDVSTPGSAAYRHFLTPQQFRQRFAPAQADVTSVQQFLRNAGF